MGAVECEPVERIPAFQKQIACLPFPAHCRISLQKDRLFRRRRALLCRAPRPRARRIAGVKPLIRQNFTHFRSRVIFRKIPFQKQIVSHKSFNLGKYDTGFVERFMQESSKHKEDGK